MVTGIGYRSDVEELPQPITQQRLAIIVPQLMKGDMSVKDEIIEGHLRLAASIVCWWMPKHLHRAEDLLCSSFFGVTQAVNWAPERLKDHNITPYIYTTCKRFVTEFIQDDQVIRVPWCSYRYNQKLEDDAKFIPLVIRVAVRHKEDEENQSDEFELLDMVPGKIDQHEFIFLELLDSLDLSKRDRLIIDMIMSNYKTAEIASATGLTVRRVNQIAGEVGERFKQLLGKS